MKQKESTRRKFMRLSALGIGSLGMASVPVVGKATSEVLPLRAPQEKKLVVVCVGAHPGDPEFGCGGTLIKYSDAGHRVSVIYLTRGEAGDPTKSFAESAALRTQEAEDSCKLMGATPLFAGQTDGNTEITKEKNAAMTKLILGEKPDIVFAHWPCDTHGDHQVAGLLTLNAWVRSGRQFQLFFYEVNTGDETMAFVPTDYVDISEVRDRKKAALMVHKTQDPVKVYDGYFKAMEDFRGLESRVKAAEGFIHFKANVDRARLAGL